MHAVALDLNTVRLKVPENHNRKIFLTDTVGLVMRYPTIKLFETLKANNGKIDIVLEIIAKCVECIIDGVKTIPADTYALAEIKEFLENLTNKQFEKVIQFFETMPSLFAEVKTYCQNCNRIVSQEIEGVETFFGLDVVTTI
jgi:hypothetical protein